MQNVCCQGKDSIETLFPDYVIFVKSKILSRPSLKQDDPDFFGTEYCLEMCTLFICYSLFVFCYLTQIELGKGRKISLMAVPSANRWQDVVLGRMKWTTVAIEKQVSDTGQNETAHREHEK